MRPNLLSEKKLHKIIHVDMDCFYAAIEIRDNPALADKPVAVGGAADKRGVLCTCNYIARQYGVRSAMPTALAYRQCRDLIVLPVNMAKYRQVAKRIQAVFHEFATLVEPLSLDEAYLDVTAATHYQGSATRIAEAIRQRIWETERLTASAGVAPNKFLAKIASGWKKPNGLYVIRPEAVVAFVNTLPVAKLYGVGRVTAEKLHHLRLKTCADVQQKSLLELTSQFGKLGQQLYEQCRGIDHRAVQPDRMRKSVSVEATFAHDISDATECLQIMYDLYDKLVRRVQEITPRCPIKNQFIKLKFSDFKLTSVEVASNEIHLERYEELFHASFAREKKPLRLLGLGVNFSEKTAAPQYVQLTLF
jgi:DNA polymerase-4